MHEILKSTAINFAMAAVVVDDGDSGEEWTDVAGVLFKHVTASGDIAFDQTLFTTSPASAQHWQTMRLPVHAVRCLVRDVNTSSFVNYFTLRLRGRDLIVHTDAFKDRYKGNVVCTHVCTLGRLPPAVMRVFMDVITTGGTPSDLTDHLPPVCFLRVVVALNVSRFRDAVLQIPRQPRTVNLFRTLYDLRFALLPAARTPALYVDSHFIHVDDALMPCAPAWKLPLMAHQKQSLRWMQMVEQRMQEGMNFVTCLMYTPIGNTGYAMLLDKNVVVPLNAELLHEQRQRCTYHGAILADRTGSGKTAVALGLLVSSERRVACQEHVVQGGMVPVDMVLCRVPVKASMVAVPLNLCKQWMREIDKFVDARHLKVLRVFNKHDYDALTVEAVAACDVVIVSTAFLTGRSYGREMRVPDYYDSLAVAERVRTGSVSGSEPVRFSDFLWRRIIYDEAHELRALPDTITTNLVAEMYWGLTGTPPFNNTPRQMNHIFHMKPAVADLWPVMYADFVAATLRSSEATINLPPPTVHEHVVDMSSREQVLAQTYALHGIDILIQISTCFNVITLFNTESGSGTSGGGGGASNQQAHDDHEFTLMTFAELARIMLHRHQAVLQVYQRRVDDLRARVQHDREVMAVMCSRSGEDAEALLMAGAARVAASTPAASASAASHEHDMSMSGAVDDTPPFPAPAAVPESGPSGSGSGGALGSTSALRSLVRQVCQNMKTIETSEERIADVQRKLAFCQAQLAEQRGPCPICMDVEADVITPCAHWFCHACFSMHLATQRDGASTCPICKAVVRREEIRRVQASTPPLGDQDDVHMTSPASSAPASVSPSLADRCGNKLVHVIELLCEIKSRGERAIMFVQWTSLMRVVRATLHEAGVEATQIYGNSNTRDLAIKKMQRGEVDVLLLSLETSSSGLNLVEANHVIFAHALTHSSAQTKRALAEQAVARVQRLGQTRPVHVHWFITRGTEETVFRS